MFKLKTFVYPSLFLLGFMPLVVSAQVQRVQLEVNSQSSGQEVIRLKQLIQQQHPRANLANVQIQSVEVQAKSRQGQAMMRLNIGGTYSAAQNIDGNPQTFNSDLPRTFSRLNFQAPPRANQNGVWQLEMQGQIKVARIVVSLSTQRVPPAPTPALVTQNLGSYRFNKIIEGVERVSVNKNNLKTIELTSVKNSIEIFEVRALLADGSEVYLDELIGSYRTGTKRTIRFDALRGERVRSIVIRAVTSNLIGSRGEIEVRIGSYD